ncbi:MAG: hypothetical protein IKR38_04935 [Bacteroidales bacterium]|nr:hypothetical protein [Bacteroidales bacterium]
MKRWVLLLLLFGCSVAAAQEKVMFWNLENFFDYRNDSTSVSDAEFSSRGPKRWTRKRFNAKCNAVAKTILWAGGEMGDLPDIVGFAEVENGFVLRRLLQGTALRKTDYAIVHYDSPDPRGIDVALLYRRTRLKLLSARPCHIYGADSTVMATRDILTAHFAGPGGDIAVLVNHHPSKYGGAESEPRRERAVERLAFLADSLGNIGLERVVAMGDFNDTPDNPMYSALPLENLALPLQRKGFGTIKYDGRWELIDLFFVSGAIGQSHMEILQAPFLLKDDGSGQKPLRTYSGPRYLGGVSDHCPVWLDVK